MRVAVRRSAQAGLTQPTLSRQVAAAERQWGVPLFERIGKSIVITQSGLALLTPARAMAAAADELRVAASGHSESLSGVVVISAAEAVAAYLLPPVLRELRRTAPALVVEVVTSDERSDLHELQRAGDAEEHPRQRMQEEGGGRCHEAHAVLRDGAEGDLYRQETGQDDGQACGASGRTARRFGCARRLKGDEVIGICPWGSCTSPPTRPRR